MRSSVARRSWHVLLCDGEARQARWGASSPELPHLPAHSVSSQSSSSLLGPAVRPTRLPPPRPTVNSCQLVAVAGRPCVVRCDRPLLGECIVAGLATSSSSPDPSCWARRRCIVIVSCPPTSAAGCSRISIPCCSLCCLHRDPHWLPWVTLAHSGSRVSGCRPDISKAPKISFWSPDTPRQRGLTLRQLALGSA